ncbi:glycosyltransferase [Vibrio sp. V01_P9A10T6]|uniref:glycosyltransferase n=1 Tax=Vibrio sp. V01_P9A10T6 TaxID=2116368 RepID=UPI000D033E34|nr:glycosyltransferase [Vibrio sp. V01_P9A10T6]PRQ62662.1 hypothetical protein BWR16_09390 [Vibrio sp. V01_P9A10T6]
MRVGIGLKLGSYTPEAYAYEKFLTENGIEVQLEDEVSLCIDNDINIYFMGFRPAQIHKKKTEIEIHEYQSLSTYPLAKFKDYLKININKKPERRIFLNEIVKNRLNFNDDIPYIYRDMGVDKEFYQVSHNKKNFDIVYSGSIHGRKGLINELYRLASLGFKLLIIGDVDSTIMKIFSRFNNSVIFTGRVRREDLPDLYNMCRAGLNYTPNIYPFNIQTSTKTLEYLASGLMVITNSYYWSNRFFAGQNQHCIFLEDLNNYIEIECKDMRFNSIEDYEWNVVLRKSGFYNFIKGNES